MSAALLVRNLSAGYGPMRVLENVALEAPRGELTVVVGPNGAGKSTLLRAISGIIPRQGEVLFDGEPLPARASAIVSRGLAQVPEGRQLFAQMTVLENLELGGYLVPRAERAERLERVLALFPRLAERRRQLAGTMSGGEQQMLAVARALMSRPKLLLMDEPSLGLAPLVVEEIFRIVAELHRDGTTIFLVEQNAHMALQVAHHFYLMEQGRVTFSGTPGEVAEDEVIQRAYLGSVQR